MNPVEIIIKKRNGSELEREELAGFIGSYLKGEIDNSQMSALLMAIYFTGMSRDEIRNLTEVYIKSGEEIKFPAGMLTTDKHSTGGVGDKISLMLASVVAACGLPVPMISGRGLGHTGGTLDKLESIPGFRTEFSQKQFKQMVSGSGLAIISQSEKLVPADRHIYALRDTTGTVESLPLITASIMSKKIAEGARYLVIDLKVGSGAFMKEMDQARKLGELLQATGQGFGQRVKVVYTNMNSPLGYYCGNGLEVLEAINYLKGESAADIDEITRRLALEMLLLSGVISNQAEAEKRIEQVISSGKALDKFAEMIRQQGGNPAVIENKSLLPQAKYKLSVKASESGWIKTINSSQIGYALVSIGAGRRTLQDKLDLSAGAYLPNKIGDRLEAGEELGRVFCNDLALGKTAVKRIMSAYEITSEKIDKETVILQA